MLSGSWSTVTSAGGNYSQCLPTTPSSVPKYIVTRSSRWSLLAVSGREGLNPYTARA